MSKTEPDADEEGQKERDRMDDEDDEEQMLHHRRGDDDEEEAENIPSDAR